MKTTVVFLLALFSLSYLYAQPVIDGFNVYYGDLHNHCNVSDGQGTIDNAYSYAKNVSQLDFFGLSDHANLISASEWTQIKNTANSYNQDGVFAAFYGFEWTTYLSYGHVTVVNTDDYCSNNSPTNNFSGLLNWVNARNCLAFFNHPGWEFYTYNEFDHFTDTPSSRFVGMELWNTQDGFSKYYYNDGYYSGDGNKGYYDEALMRHWKIGAAGGDDNHTANWGNLTPWRTGVLATTKTRSEIFNAYQARRIFSTLDKTLILSFKVNGFMMGSTILGGSWNAVINAFDQENELFTQVDLVKNGSVIYTTIPNSIHPVIVRPVTCADGDYFYARVKQADGDEAISSPVFISGVAQPPTVAISSPGNGSIFTAGSGITLTANASDPDGTIASVQFYDGDNLLGEDNAAPYSFVWTTNEVGIHLIHAKAFDNLGLTTVSGTITITVDPLPTLVVAPTLQNVTFQNGSTAFTVSSNVAWTVTSDQPWCLVTPSGFANGTITAEYSENTSPVSRFALVTITATGISPSIVTVLQEAAPNKTLNLRLIVQGLYDSALIMHPAMDESGVHWGDSIADRITVQLHDSSNYSAIILEIPDIELHTDGTVSMTIPPFFSGNYYIVIRHRNSIETVSMLPVSFAGSTVFYDFTSSAAKAFGSNMIQMTNGKWALYSGDVNQDGIVDSEDLILVDNSAATYPSGYLAGDCNGDGLVDMSDMLIIETNSGLLISAITP
jgi:hypothetical protein